MRITSNLLFGLFLTVVALNLQAQEDAPGEIPFEYTIKTFVAGKSESGKILLKDLQRTGGVIVKTNEGQDNLEVISYTISINFPTGLIECVCRGANLSAKCKEYILQVKPGQEVEFKYIKVRDPKNEGVIRSAPSLTFKAVNTL